MKYSFLWALSGLFVAGLQLASCSDDDSGPRDRAEFCQDWAEAACSDDTVTACQSSSQDTCRLAQQSYCLETVPMSFSDARGNQCIDAVGDAYDDADLTGTELDTVRRLGGDCSGIVTGTRALGQSCDTNNDCDRSTGVECVGRGGLRGGICQVPEQVGPGRLAPIRRRPVLMASTVTAATASPPRPQGRPARTTSSALRAASAGPMTPAWRAWQSARTATPTTSARRYCVTSSMVTVVAPISSGSRPPRSSAKTCVDGKRLTGQVDAAAVGVYRLLGGQGQSGARALTSLSDAIGSAGSVPPGPLRSACRARAVSGHRNEGCPVCW